MAYRIRELDWLRGIAVLLVISRHLNFTNSFLMFGWIGVDLFFVLSGYLVSSLLFAEFKNTNQIDYCRFVVRRFMRILPPYYVGYFLYFICLHNQINATDNARYLSITSDLLLIQNYRNGLGYIMGHNWSLAVEEHFYLLTILIFYLILRFDGLFAFLKRRPHRIFFIGYICLLVVKMYTVYFTDTGNIKSFTMSHLRFDGILIGVYISFLHNFYESILFKFSAMITKYQTALMVIAIVPTLFFEPFESTYMRGIGFSLESLYFGSVVVTAVSRAAKNEEIEKRYSKILFSLISAIGTCSYSVYLIHVLVIHLIENYMSLFKLALTPLHLIAYFFFTYIAVIIAGFIMHRTIENPLSRVRNKLTGAR